MKKKKVYPKLEDLNEVQRKHLAFRLDHYTFCGMLTACRIARLESSEMNNLRINQLFERFDMTPQQAKIHAKKVERFKL